MSKISLMATLLFVLGGCSASQPIKAWQQRLTDYTMKEGHGDLNVLRESAELRSTDSLRPARIRFDHDDIAAAGLPPFVDRFDAHGVMVGQHDAGKKPMFFFLVGVVERPYSGRAAKVEDVRLVSCTVRESNHHWRLSEPNPGALNKYLASSPANALRPGGHPVHRTFPLDDDDFRFEIRDGYAHATDARSGAMWRISLN